MSWKKEIKKSVKDDIQQLIRNAEEIMWQMEDDEHFSSRSIKALESAISYLKDV